MTVRRDPRKSSRDKQAAPTRGARLTVLDLFSGAGGFSEGFRSAGFSIVGGVEKSGPAIDTFNINFGLDIGPRDILYFEKRPDRIEELPDTDVIVGSPPCVSFSYSNKYWSGDKSHGIRLIKVFLAIIAVKKHKPNSCLKGWFMENVPNALKSMKATYSFWDLGLAGWSRSHGLDARSTAVSLVGNSEILDAADYGVPQVRKRLFVHEYLCKKGRKKKWNPRTIKRHLTLRETAFKLPGPNCKPSNRQVRDPLYPAVKIPLRYLTDHFYETGAFESHWRESKFLKTNHPYMGRMSFPERYDRPSRTVVASRFPRSRETLLFKSEWNRRGNGEYRSPTIREAATLMGFPITYQFSGSESTKWTLVGNAVCPLLAQKLARQFLSRLGKMSRTIPRKRLSQALANLSNLNTFKRTTFGNAPRRNRLSRFRRHPFKASGMAVTLSNYDLRKNGQADGTWRCSVTYGIGKGYGIQRIRFGRIPAILDAVKDSGPEGVRFSKYIRDHFRARVAPARLMQRMYERNISLNGYENPAALIDKAATLIDRHVKCDVAVEMKSSLLLREEIPKRQLFALLAIVEIARTAESRRGIKHE